MEVLYQEVVPAVSKWPVYLACFALSGIGAFILLSNKEDAGLRGQAYAMVILGAIYGGIALFGNKHTVDTEKLYIDISEADPYEESVKWEAAGWELSETKGRLYILEREAGKG